jgi:hypothetical protein
VKGSEIILRLAARSAPGRHKDETYTRKLKKPKTAWDSTTLQNIGQESICPFL